MNLYGYAAGDPINNSDPFGLDPTSLVVMAVQAAPVVQAAAAVGAAKMAAVGVALWSAGQSALPYLQAGALNTIAGSSLGASLGYPNEVGVNSHGNLQPRNAQGRWASNASNPGLGAAIESNRGYQATVGAVQGFFAGKDGVPMPKAISTTQEKFQEYGKWIGELVDAWTKASPED